MRGDDARDDGETEARAVGAARDKGLEQAASTSSGRPLPLSQKSMADGPLYLARHMICTRPSAPTARQALSTRLAKTRRRRRGSSSTVRPLRTSTSISMRAFVENRGVDFIAQIKRPGFHFPGRGIIQQIGNQMVHAAKLVLRSRCGFPCRSAAAMLMMLSGLRRSWAIVADRAPISARYVCCRRSPSRALHQALLAGGPPLPPGCRQRSAPT